MATIQHKRNATAGVAPAAGSLSAGELAVNTADGKVFTKRDNGAVVAMALDADVVKLTGDQTVAGVKTFSANAIFSSTGAITIPSGTTSQRPGTPTAGMIRYNSTRKSPEWYDADADVWRLFVDDILEVEYLVVGGGGGSNSSVFGAGGGGAGGFRTNVGATPLSLASGTSYTVTVGAGGAVAAQGGTGGASSFGGIESAGGGGSAANGGSGGGALALGPTVVGLGNTPSTSPSQGNNGGQGSNGGSGCNGRLGGGGGGAGAVGVSAVASTSAGDGGAGTASSISGSSVTYAGGGGGGAWVGSGACTPFEGGTGGTGGGGKGGGTTAATAGAVNTGGGGGGAGRDGTTDRAGQAGGSGIVIVRYLGTPRAVGGTVTQSGGYTIHTFTSSGTFSAPFAA